MQSFEYQVLSAILGHATADALGVPVEFMDRSHRQADPVTGMREYGTHHQPMGTWSDDTSMTIAALDSLAHGLDYSDVMIRFADWMVKAAYTATGEIFDIGISSRHAIYHHLHGTPALSCGCTGDMDNGNGSLMRIIPFVLYCHKAMPDAPLAEKLAVIHNASCLTHAHIRSQIGCGIYACVLFRLLEEPSRDSVFRGLRDARDFYLDEPELRRYLRIFEPDFAALAEEQISSGGYVVHTLEAALWCLLNTGSYHDCVLKAVNLGSDTDTVAAVAGGLAGLFYGLDAIPADWLAVLKKRDYLEQLCRSFAAG